MNPPPRPSIRDQLDALYRSDSRRVFASLVRILKDFELADDAMHEAFAAAVVDWERDGVPASPTAWLVSTGRFKAIDTLRRQGRLKELQGEIAARMAEVATENASRAEGEIEDDRLRLIFTCCHPEIDPRIRVPLTLREVCGLTTEEIARAFLTTKGSMAQRIVRGKAKIREAGIPFVVPSLSELPARLDAVLSAIYLVFNEGYSASQGEAPIRANLTAEAIRLGRLLHQLLPEPEVKGLLALMLLHESRREARVSDDGEIILMEDQDRRRWDQRLIAEGIVLVEDALRSRRFGAYTLQGAISAIHAEAPTADQTDWNQIVVLYSALLQIEPSPVIELNRAVAVAMRDGPEAGLAIIDAILARGDLADYHLAHSARGELLCRAGEKEAAIAALTRAAELTQQEAEKRLLNTKIERLRT
ncbi:RNA polymerase sigma factor [Blastopirellula sp. JC732]|uniref:RNA polymerase sigma factor n=1 Tax=Blastopirellula sediminis TaxID=2894196 RepID=A0A9X1SHC4_9BACT|nr:RNA polymerase sigma factor [Blastopirellula sediminis]MCC9605655.1 RNA polymerase sigma factor [Blastopirellula sediminis]MCC9631045.1 RNA polymerase sigma factor [Blastopirellula sediminis]